MLDDTWTHGSDDASITTSIKEGRLAQGMPAWKATLSDQDIRALVIYIRENAAKAKREKTTFAKPAAETNVQSEKHAFKLADRRRRREVALVDLVPSRRAHARHRKDRPAPHRRKGPLAAAPVGGVPAVWSKGQGGLLDVAVHPDYAKNGWIYLSYSDPGADDSAMTAIVRGKLRDGQFVDQETLFKAPAELYRTGNVHFGSRFVFDGKGHVFFSIGERGRGVDAQDLSRPNGKVHRINEDGSIPKDNPFVGKANALPTIWSYGNRNPQGLAQHPVDGRSVGSRTRPARRRRAESHRGRQELRLADDHLRDELRRHADDGQDGAGGHGTARHLLGAVHRRLRDRLLSRQRVSAVEGQPARVVARRAGAAPAASSRTTR